MDLVGISFILQMQMTFYLVWLVYFLSTLVQKQIPIKSVHLQETLAIQISCHMKRGLVVAAEQLFHY